MAELTADMVSALQQTASRLNIADPQWLTNLIAFETGGTFDPQASNPRSSAKGLIQFIDSTAIGMGFESSKDLVMKYPGFREQLEGPVYNYLKQYAPYNSEYKLYMSVFYPAAVKYPADTTFKQIYADRISNAAQAKTAYERFIKANPGILTPQHYVDFVKKKVGIVAGSTGPGTVIIVLGVIAAIWLFGRKKRSRI